MTYGFFHRGRAILQRDEIPPIKRELQVAKLAKAVDCGLAVRISEIG